MCNALNDYVLTTGSALLAQLNANNSHASNDDYKIYCDNSVQNSMFVYPVDMQEIMHKINSINNNKAPGPDNIGPNLIKYIADIICYPLSHVFNLSLSTGKIPNQLKIAKVVHIYKKGIKN
jgi:hypothetical protein